MNRWGRVERLASALLGVAVAYLLVSQILARSDALEQADQKQQAQEAAAEASQDARAVADPLVDLCRSDPSVAQRAGEACRKATEVQQQPVEPVAVGPSSAEIRAAVADYLRRNPPPAGESATLDQITAAVAGYLQANPPQPGHPPTSDEVRSAVALYLADNPPAAGPAGADGDPGRPPTDAEIDAAVARYFAANPPPKGEPGRGISNVRVENCRLLVTYTSGETEDVGNTCGVASPETTTETTTVTSTEKPGRGLLPSN